MGRNPGSILRPESGLKIGPESGAQAPRFEEFGRRVAKNLGAGFEAQSASASRPKGREIQALVRGQRQRPHGAATKGSALSRLGTQCRGQVANVETQSARLLDPLQQAFQNSRVGLPHRATLSDQRITFQTTT